MPGLGVGPKAAVCSVTEKGKTNLCLPVAGADLTFAGWWVSFQVVIPRGRLSSFYLWAQARAQNKGHRGSFYFFLNQYRWRFLLLCRFLRLKLVTLTYVKIKILYFFLKPSAYLPSYWALVIMLPQQNSMRQVVWMGTGGDRVCAGTQSWQGGHLLCQLSCLLRDHIN